MRLSTVTFVFTVVVDADLLLLTVAEAVLCLAHHLLKVARSFHAKSAGSKLAKWVLALQVLAHDEVAGRQIVRGERPRLILAGCCKQKRKKKSPAWTKPVDCCLPAFSLSTLCFCYCCCFFTYQTQSRILTLQKISTV